jgi:hypothetical protein
MIIQIINALRGVRHRSFDFGRTIYKHLSTLITANILQVACKNPYDKNFFTISINSS